MKVRIVGGMAAIAVMFISVVCSAQVRYYDVTPDRPVLGTAPVPVHPAKHYDSVVHMEYGSLMFRNFEPGIVFSMASGCEILLDTGTPAVLDSGQIISNAGHWGPVFYGVLYNGSTGHWKAAERKFLPVRTMINGSWHYGWIQLSVNGTGDSGVVHSYALELQPETQIVTGTTALSSIALIPFEKTPIVSYDVQSIVVRQVSGKFALRITDMFGSVLFFRSGLTAPFSIPRSFLPPGTYILSVETLQGTWRLKAGTGM